MIAASMKRFPDDAEVQKYACWAIDRLVQYGHTYCSRVVQAGLRQLVEDAMAKHSDEKMDHVQTLRSCAQSALHKLQYY